MFSSQFTYYRATANNYPTFAPLLKQSEAAVVVIGGGYAGLNTALSLAERGVRDIILIEREQIGYGASGRNGGFVFAGYSLGEQALLRQLGAPTARNMHHLSIEAVNLIRRRITTYKIDCSTVDEGVIWANWFHDPEILRARQRLLAESYGVDWQWISAAELREQVRSSRYNDALFERNALHFHPLNYAIGVAQTAASKGVQIHEHTPALFLNRKGASWKISTPQGSIQAKQVILACGGYLAGLNHRIDRAVLPIATYVMVTEPLQDRLQECLKTRAAIYDTRFAFDYYRPLPDARLLWGGRISVRERSAKEIARLLKRDLLKVFPQLHNVNIDYAWSGLMSYARHQMPQIGCQPDGFWYTQAFGGHGVAPTTAAGELIAAAIADGDSAWQQFQPYGLVNTYKPFGYAAAQASYWWHQWRDAIRK